MNTQNQDLLAILQVLKQTLRTRGYVYADVAQHLQIAEITIKRLLSGSSVSMTHLLAICDFLQVPFLEIAAAARDLEYPEYELSKAQDHHFAKQPKLYALFIDLYRRNSPSEVKKYWSLSDQAFFRRLRELEKLGLLDVLPANRYRFKIKGPVKIPLRGQLRKVFLRQNLEFLEKVQKEIANPAYFLRASEMQMTKQNCEEFLTEMQALIKKFRSRAFSDETLLAANRKTSIRWLFACAPHETDWRKEGSA